MEALLDFPARDPRRAARRSHSQPRQERYDDILPFLVESPPAVSTERRAVLSFDVEEHDRIEAAAGLSIAGALKACYSRRLETSTRWLLEQLGHFDVKATFFVVGQVARAHPALIRAIDRDGHELASHGWDHRRLHHLTPAQFRRDIKWSTDALEQITGTAVVGYRAPTFSVVRQTAWAIDELVDHGIAYDSSIYPVLHDRYGVPDAPRTPFRACGTCNTILELPLATLRVLGVNLPVAGGGYFRLLPRFFMEAALRERAAGARQPAPAVTTLYFHPWEFDPFQPRLPLRLLSAWRTYWGIFRNRGRFRGLLARYRFVRAADLLPDLEESWPRLPQFNLAGPQARPSISACGTIERSFRPA